MTAGSSPAEAAAGVDAAEVGSTPAAAAAAAAGGDAAMVERNANADTWRNFPPCLFPEA